MLSWHAQGQQYCIGFTFRAVFNHLFVEMSTGYTSDITYSTCTLMNGMQCYFTPMALDINTATHPHLHSVNIILFIFPCAYVHAQFAMIMMHKTNTLCRVSVSVLVFSGQNRPLSRIIIHLPVLVSGIGCQLHTGTCMVIRRDMG